MGGRGQRSNARSKVRHKPYHSVLKMVNINIQQQCCILSQTIWYSGEVWLDNENGEAYWMNPLPKKDGNSRHLRLDCPFN